jgi:hypothetical protein
VTPVVPVEPELLGVGVVGVVTGALVPEPEFALLGVDPDPELLELEPDEDERDEGEPEEDEDVPADDPAVLELPVLGELDALLEPGAGVLGVPAGLQALELAGATVLLEPDEEL